MSCYRLKHTSRPRPIGCVHCYRQAVKVQVYRLPLRKLRNGKTFKVSEQ